MDNKKLDTLRDNINLIDDKLLDLLRERAETVLEIGKQKKSKMDLVVIAPGGVFGPPLGDNISCESLNIVSKVLNGKIPMVPDAAFPMVDVRDVAKLNVQALTNSKVSGKRFIASGTDPVSFAEVAQLLLNQGFKGPSTKKAPNWLFKILSLFDAAALKYSLHTNEKFRRFLYCLLTPGAIAPISFILSSGLRDLNNAAAIRC